MLSVDSGSFRMATGVLWSAIFLGNVAEMDTDESDHTIETDAPAIGTFGSAGDPLYKKTLEMSTTSTDGDDLIEKDNVGTTDTVSYDVGSGTQTTTLDGVGFFNGTVTFLDGSTATDSFALIQDDTGNLFLMPLASGGTDLTAQAIESIQITGENSTNFIGAQQNGPFNSNQFVCFASGSMISCPDGDRPVEDLREGHLVETLDHGPQPLIWTGHRELTFPESPDTQKPVEIKPGALGPSAPARTLILSPQHRVLLRSNAFIAAAGRSEVLVPAKAMLNRSDVRVMAGKRSVTYHSLLFRRHAVIFANGLAVESLYPGKYAMTLFSRRQQLQILSRIPTLMADPVHGYDLPARPFFGPGAYRKLIKSINSVVKGVTPEEKSARAVGSIS